MILGRRATCLVLAVIVPAVLLLAVPAWSEDKPAQKQESTTEDKAERTGSTRADKDSEQTTSKKPAETERTTEKKDEGSTAREESKPSSDDKNDNDKKNGKEARKGKSEKASIVGEEVEVQPDDTPKDEVSKGDTLVIKGIFKTPEKGASITLKDKEGIEGTFVNGENATMELGSLKIKVNKDPVKLSKNANKLSTQGLKVVETKGIKLKKNGKNKNRRGRGGNDCDIKNNQTNNGFNQYTDIDQVCIIEKINDGGGGGGGGRAVRPFFPPFFPGFDFADPEDIFELLEEDDGEIVFVEEPAGEVQDTSVIEVLPNTGGPGAAGGALVAGLALLGAGVGISIWRLGSRREG